MTLLQHYPLPLHSCLVAPPVTISNTNWSSFAVEEGALGLSDEAGCSGALEGQCAVTHMLIPPLTFNTHFWGNPASAWKAKPILCFIAGALSERDLSADLVLPFWTFFLSFRNLAFPISFFEGNDAKCLWTPKRWKVLDTLGCSPLLNQIDWGKDSQIPGSTSSSLHWRLSSSILIIYWTNTHTPRGHATICFLEALRRVLKSDPMQSS